MSVIAVDDKYMDDFIKVEIEPEKVPVVRETLTRIGIANTKKKEITQTCHLIEEGGEFYLMHFKEYFIHIGRLSNIDECDYARRNAIAVLLSNWGLIKLSEENKKKIYEIEPVKSVFVLSHSEKPDWIFRKKI